MKNEFDKDLPDNPNAFPVIDSNGGYGQLGMDLRDYFAAKAMQGNLAACNPGFIDKDFATELAKTFYIMADAMLKERQKLIIEVSKRRDISINDLC